MKKTAVWLQVTFFALASILISLQGVSRAFAAKDKNGNKIQTTNVKRKDIGNYKSLPKDKISWNFQGVQRVISIGDLHGDFNALVNILTNLDLIDSKGNWIGGKTNIVQTGDLVDGAGDSRLILDYIKDTLEPQMKKAGGRFHKIFGNHELLVASGDLEHMSEAEEELLTASDENASVKKNELQRMTKEEFKMGPYADWLLTFNSIVKINRTVFCHAGLDAWILNNFPDEINATSRAWVKYWQDRGEEPPPETAWVVGLTPGGLEFSRASGPTFIRGFKIEMGDDGDLIDSKSPDGPKYKRLKEILTYLDADRLVVGHEPTPDLQIHREHPYYKEMVNVIDTHMSTVFGGNLSALEIRLDDQGRDVLSIHQFDRYVGDHPVRKIQLAKTTGKINCVSKVGRATAG